MKLIIVRQGRKSSLTLDSARWRDRGLLILFGCLPLLLGVAITSLYTSDELRDRESALLAQWRQALGEQVSSAVEARTQAFDELSALKIKVAELQARIMRLDALGEQIVEVSRLDGGEFDFSRRPAAGGPELITNEMTAPLGEQVATLLSASDVSRNVNDADSQALLVSYSSLAQRLADLTFHVESQEQQLGLLDRQLAMRESRIDAFVAGRPVKRGWMSSAFGKRTDPFSGKSAWHQGVDFAGKANSDVIAVAGGVVTSVATRSGYGKTIELNHGNGYVTRYAHNKMPMVQVGDVVKKGQIIAKMGSTGRSTGPHVHFEVIRNGKAMNPERYIYRASL